MIYFFQLMKTFIFSHHFIWFHFNHLVAVIFREDFKCTLSYTIRSPLCIHFIQELPKVPLSPPTLQNTAGSNRQPPHTGVTVNFRLYWSTCTHSSTPIVDPAGTSLQLEVLTRGLSGPG